ncbi:uncharacterized protein LOC126591620 isoform X1 [Malus sylvestris]|nr:uncharacterized protein LOC126591620 isoform X1 [Malus sylvestris]
MKIGESRRACGIWLLPVKIPPFLSFPPPLSPPSPSPNARCVSAKPLDMGGRGVIGDRWSMRILWACAIGSAVSLYMVAVDRQLKNRERALAEELKAMEAESGSGLILAR